jgi:hypothetical protein
MKRPEFEIMTAFRKVSFNKSVRKAGKAASREIKVSARIFISTAVMITASRSALI